MWASWSVLDDQRYDIPDHMIIRQGQGLLDRLRRDQIRKAQPELKATAAS
jgi:hypothetical protein